MIRYENECVGCTGLGLPCMGDSCPNRMVPRFYCDRCKEEVDDLYDFDGEELCGECVLKSLEKVVA